ncbi:rhodanese-related sulfurtransferase [Populibacterium corticicola]|uniref:tRNA uridine(34) hydroxylase n=1 Tax=Populibacterium corticicola TaxID=1812826 RepID=A0ABW5XFY8_9MICO
MAVNKIILFYAFAPVADPTAVKLWQRALGEQWNLKGRVIVSPHGINATLGGTVEDLKRYVKATKQYPGFGKMDVKWSDGMGEDFPRLSVKERPELVAFGAPDEVTVDKHGVVGGGTHLKPEEVNKLVEEYGDDVVFFDGRNAFEAQIGRFQDAIVPDVQTTHGFIQDLESGKYDDIKNKKIISYCTGGIRCEILSVLMKNRGFEDVYQIEGGIVRYGEQFGSKGLWDGPLYVFDKRMVVNFDEETTTLGECSQCQAATSDFHNCADPGCKVLRLYCENCVEVARTQVCPDCVERLATV